MFVYFVATMTIKSLISKFLHLDIMNRLNSRDLRRFEFESDDCDSITKVTGRFEISNRPHLPSYHKPRSLFNKKTLTVEPL